MAKTTIDQVDVASKRVLVRVDFNVPLEGGTIADDRRIQAAIPTIRSITDRGGRAILMSHLGRPEGDGYEESSSLEPVAARLAELLGTPVAFPSHDCIDAAAAAAVQAMKDADVLLLENLRFHKHEKNGNPGFAAKLAAYADVYVNDAFGTCHRKDASMVAVPKAMEGKPRVAGFLVANEIRTIGDALSSPARPFAVVLGGVKVSDKIGAIRNMLDKADHVLIGGAMAYTFCKALGQNVGASKVEDDKLGVARELIDKAANLNVDAYLPVDHVCSTQFARIGGDVQIFDQHVKDGYIGLDIGPKTQSQYASILRKARTIIWNGPMGVFEWAPFAVGTQQIAAAIADATRAGATSIVGGGDTAAAAEKFEIADKVTHVSTGGGATLAMLAGETFESVELLDDA
jgi:phosphoglycerate kinase